MRKRDALRRIVALPDEDREADYFDLAHGMRAIAVEALARREDGPRDAGVVAGALGRARWVIVEQAEALHAFREHALVPDNAGVPELTWRTCQTPRCLGAARTVAEADAALGGDR